MHPQSLTTRSAPAQCALAAVAALPIALLMASASCAAGFTLADLQGVRSVSNYLFAEDAHSVPSWERDLDRMKQSGLNTVWMVNVWADYEPNVDPPTWREDRVEALRGICAAAKARDMSLILVLAYIGEGWGPQGVDVPVWPLVERHRLQHLDFLRRMAKETRDFDNVFYLLCSEEILPGTLLYSPTKRPECVESFRAWAKQANGDVAYWNERWGTSYTWEDLSPADTTNRPRWQLWADHSRWHGALMRQLLPPMVSAIREERPNAIIGYHDFLLPDKNLGLTVEDGGLPLPSPADFYSIGYYYDRAMEGGLEANLQALKDRVARARELYPDLPIFVGELGLDAKTEPPETRREEEALQADFLVKATDYLRSEKVGFSLWCWRTVVKGSPTTFSLVREDGTASPALERLSNGWAEAGGG